MIEKEIERDKDAMKAFQFTFIQFFEVPPKISKDEVVPCRNM